MTDSNSKERESKVKTFVKKHKKKLLIGAITVGAGLSALGLSKLVKIEPRPFTERYFNSLSLDKLNEVREAVQRKLWASGDDSSTAIYWEHILNMVDNVIRSRDPDGIIPRPPTYPREHGHNLYKTD